MNTGGLGHRGLAQHNVATEIHVKKMFKSKEVGFKEKAQDNFMFPCARWSLMTKDTLFTRPSAEAEVMMATSTRGGRPSTSTQAEGGLQHTPRNLQMEMICEPDDLSEAVRVALEAR